ncbi:hypothetical protein PORY_000967 [Pneumocystis oryctolagi]|uniref:Uncharacterized protein n=1 Tax=Pneumocystis oryctolagi TaxID=42067 RepID=A0ACB7CCY2_9ASCO|nr:hypothetical protein PORY_000967 [Pneumocystis oryctolagi]
MEDEINQGNFQEIIVVGTSNETSVEDIFIYVYDLHTGSQIMKFKENDSTLKGITVTENYIFSNQKKKPMIHIYTWQKESICQKMFVPEALSVFTLSHDVCWGIGGTSEGKLYVWQVTDTFFSMLNLRIPKISSGNLVFVHHAHYQKITAITFTMDNTFFLTGSEDSSLCLWRLSDVVDLHVQKDNIRAVKTWNDHRLSITDIVCGFGTANMARVFTSSLDNTVNVWDLGTQSLLTTFVLQNPVTCLTIDPTEKAFYAGTDAGNIYLVDLYRPSEENSSESFYEAVGGSKKIIQGVKDESYVFKGHESTVLCITLSFDGSLLITGSEDKNVFVWDIATRQMIQSFRKQNGPITSISCKVVYQGFFSRKMILENIPFFKRVQNIEDTDNYYILKKLEKFTESENETLWYENDLMSMKNDLSEFMSVTSEPALKLQIKNLQDELQKLYGYYSELKNIHQDLWTVYLLKIDRWKWPASELLRIFDYQGLSNYLDTLGLVSVYQINGNGLFHENFKEKMHVLVEKSADFFEELEQRLVKSQTFCLNVIILIQKKIKEEALSDFFNLENCICFLKECIFELLNKYDQISGLNISSVFLANTPLFLMLHYPKLVDLEDYLKIYIRSHIKHKIQIGNLRCKNDLKRIVIFALYDAYHEKVITFLNILSLQEITINDIFYIFEGNRPVLNIKVYMNIENPDFLKNLLKTCLQKGIFLLVALEEFQYSVPDFEISLIEKNVWIATIIGPETIPVEMLIEWFRLLKFFNIKVLRISNLTKIPLRCIEYKLEVPKLLKKERIKEKSLFITQKYALDILLQDSNIYIKKRRLIVFDMDSTLIEQEVIDEIARFYGVYEKVSAITRSCLEGEIDFSESLRQRVLLFKGASVNIFEDLKKKIVFTNGACSLCKILKKLGFKTALITGGFVPIANYVKEVLNLDYAYANNVEISEDGLYLTGNIDGCIIDGQKKAEILKSIASMEDIDMSETIAVGDGFNDLCMLKTAGLGIAFNAKPKVQEKAPNKLNAKSLMDILYVLGYSEKERTEILM